ARGQNYGLFLTATGATLALHPARAAGTAAVLRFALVGSDPSAPAAGLDPLPGQSNYFLGNDPSRWYTNIANYDRVLYQGVYSGIDLEYTSTGQRQLEYTFVVSPGADLRAIQLSVQGAGSMALDADGNLALHTAGGDVVQQAPVLYQQGSAGRERVAGRFVLLGGGRVGFDVGAYDPGRTLSIDPVVTYSTYLGGSQSDQGNGIAV